MTDVFANTSNNYVYPNVSKCPNIADDQILTWTKNGLTIIKGSEEIANIDFTDLAIPINSFNKQQKILQQGEVTFIQGLTNGLCKRQQSFIIPELVSDNVDLNGYFMQIDMSINYISNFSTINNNIDISSNYNENLNIEDALNIKFDNLSIKLYATYITESITFLGTQDGYDFTISNVKLTLIDSSIDLNSPFPNNQNAPYYILNEDTSSNINAYKYPNTAMQGIVIKTLFPDTNTVEADNWIYINHVTDYVKQYNTKDIDEIADISTGLNIQFGTTFIEPSISFDVSTLDVSIYSQIINNQTAQDSYYQDCSIYDSKFYLTTFNNTFILDSSIANNSLINNGSIINNSLLTNAWVNGLRILVYQDPCTGNKLYDYTIDDDSLNALNDVSINTSIIWDSSINNANITDTSIYNSFIKNSYLNGCTTYNCLIDTSTISVNTIDILIDPSISCDYEINYDASTYYEKTIKKLDVGLSGCSLTDTISAGDYLNWVTTNNLWKKVGDAYIWFSSIDSTDANIKNLIDGFYVFNPHSFSIKIEYLVFI